MGGGRSGLFPATKGADPYQMSLLESPIRVRHKGVIYVGENALVGGGAGSSQTAEKFIAITPKDVLNKCMQYRLEIITEFQLVDWLLLTLRNKRYNISTQLREVLKSGLEGLRAARRSNNVFDPKVFISALENFEHRLETL